MSKKSLSQYFNEVCHEVSSWPQWKQDLLGRSQRQSPDGLDEEENLEFMKSQSEEFTELINKVFQENNLSL